MKRQHTTEKKGKKVGEANISDIHRRDDSVDRSKRFLIVCEGKNTEPSYFRKFETAKKIIKVVGEGFNTLSLVKRTSEIKLAEEQKIKDKKFDEVWCVFDADPNPENPFQIQNFNAALALAKKLGFKVAYSNQAFEYWLILHFEDHQGGKMHRSAYNEKINSYLKPLNSVYDGKSSKQISEDFFDIMLELGTKTKKSRQERAIERASRILNFHNQMGNLPHRAESSTTVHQLVELLNQSF